MSTDTMVKPKTVRFVSTSDNFALTRVKPDELLGPTGKVLVRNGAEYERYRIQFRNNQLNVEVGQDVLPTGPNGEDEDVVAFLERQPSYGLFYFRQDEGAPPADDVHQLVTRLAIAQDLDGLVELARTESENWQRPGVGHAVISALSELFQAAEGDQGRQGQVEQTFEAVKALGFEPPSVEG